MGQEQLEAGSGPCPPPGSGLPQEDWLGLAPPRVHLLGLLYP